MTDDNNDCFHPDSPTEKAYRRGVHQAIAAIDHYIHKEENLDKDPASVLDVALSSAKMLRYSKDREWPMMKLIIDEIEEHLG